MASIDKDSVAWIDASNGVDPLPPIVDPKRGRRREVLLLGGPLVGVYVHWWCGRTVGCTKPRGECPGCKDATVRRDRVYYLAACTPRHWHPCLAKVTPHALSTCPELHRAECLRGRMLRLERSPEKENGCVWASLQSLRLAADTLPDPFDVQQALLAIWERGGAA